MSTQDFADRTLTLDPRKTVGFALDLGHFVRPFITPDDPDAFEAALRARLPDTPFEVTSQPRYGV